MGRIAVCLAAALAASVGATAAVGADDYGRFPNAPHGKFVPNPADGRPSFLLIADFVYEHPPLPPGTVWTAPSGTSVNGASIPGWLWSFIGGPFDGPYLNASIIHDYYCDTHEKSPEETHLAFYYGMLAEGVAPWKAKAMYWAVSTFNSSWEEQPRVVTSEVCTPQATGETVCTLETRVETQTIEVPGPDLGDPTLRAVALSKFNAVARTLKTTDGAILDVGPFGSIDASPESIAANASNFSEILETNAFINDPSVLGILSGHTGHSFDRLEAWPGGTLPLYDVAPSFQSLTAGAPGFTLAPGDVEILTGDFDFSAHSFTIPAGE